MPDVTSEFRHPNTWDAIQQAAKDQRTRKGGGARRSSARPGFFGSDDDSRDGRETQLLEENDREVASAITELRKRPSGGGDLPSGRYVNITGSFSGPPPHVGTLTLPIAGLWMLQMGAQATITCDSTDPPLANYFTQSLGGIATMFDRDRFDNVPDTEILAQLSSASLWFAETDGEEYTYFIDCLNQPFAGNFTVTAWWLRAEF